MSDVYCVPAAFNNPPAKPPETIKGHSGSKYVREIRSCVTGKVIGEVDVYCVLDAFNNPPAPIAHAIKKLLCAGLRGKGDRKQDLQEAIDAIKQQLLLEQ